MRVFNGRSAAIWTAALALMLLVGLPSASFAQGRGRGKGGGDKCDKFVNCHDARDGRVDGRGPRGNRGYDDDDYYRTNGRNRRRDDGSYGRNRSGADVGRIALENGYREGLRAGQNDRADGRRSSYRDYSAYQDGTIGYRGEYGSVDTYRRSFRDGFRRGYEDGYGSRSGRSRVGDILGGVLGRP